ncbi:MAG: hypothetical protein KY476_08140 [Planctomycetes bacterium]|nr:hypothetical protein [Planctomycetota bacterium]
MAMLTLEEMQQDELVMSVARAMALANEAAYAHGADPTTCLVTIAEETGPAGIRWRVNYGPRDYVNRRGGDLIVLVDERAGTVEQVTRGQ